MSRYNKQHEIRKQSMFLPGPVDPNTGNYTPSEAQKECVDQWSKEPAERNRRNQFFRKHGLGY